MTISWNDDQPIYRQLRDKVVGLILEGVYKEGDAIPSVRQVSSDYQINHLTVAKAYQELVDLGLVESRRGMGMYVIMGARERLLSMEKEKFITQELPQLLLRSLQLGIGKAQLIQNIENLPEEKR
ncbi:MAG: GntR family transcriptional regulator [Moraxellaceae bacterium]|nr:MAG: GntR family transcriptional regulator [Moraxellaceae bacterium]